MHRSCDVMRPLLVCAVAMASACVVGAEPEPPAAHHERVIEESVTVPEAGLLTIRNLAGVARLHASEGPAVTVRATVRAGGDDEEDARLLAERIAFSTQERRGDVELTVTYPVEEYSSFHYESDGSSGILSWFGGGSTRVRYMDRRVDVSTRRHASAATVHADLEIGVPAGVRLHLVNAIGRATAQGVAADLKLEVDSGEVSSSGGSGNLVLDTGSGSIEVDGHAGNVSADTGSGGVVVQRIQGEVRVDTGSGSVRVREIEGPFVGVDTGSGSVSLDQVAGALDVDTGSGSVSGTGLVLGERLRVDTGSGGVRLEGDFERVRDVVVDTGSGAVRLSMSAWPSMRLDLRTSSGGLDVDLPDLRRLRSDRNSLLGEIGDDPVAEVKVSTGSGGITVRRSG